MFPADLPLCGMAGCMVEGSTRLKSSGDDLSLGHQGIGLPPGGAAEVSGNIRKTDPDDSQIGCNALRMEMEDE